MIQYLMKWITLYFESMTAKAITIVATNYSCIFFLVFSL